MSTGRKLFLAGFAALALAFLAFTALFLYRPAKVVGVDGDSLGESISSELGRYSPSGACDKAGGGRWKCAIVIEPEPGSGGGPVTYRATSNDAGCWQARSPNAFGQRKSLSGVSDEADAVAFGAAARAVGRLFGLDADLGELGEGGVEVVDAEGDVVVAGAVVVLGDAVVVGQLQARVLAGHRHEDVDRLVADRHPPHLLEAELLVEIDRAIDVADPVAGVEKGGHGWRSRLPRVQTPHKQVTPRRFR